MGRKCKKWQPRKASQDLASLTKNARRDIFFRPETSQASTYIKIFQISLFGIAWNCTVTIVPQHGTTTSGCLLSYVEGSSCPLLRSGAKVSRSVHGFPRFLSNIHYWILYEMPAVSLKSSLPFSQPMCAGLDLDDLGLASSTTTRGCYFGRKISRSIQVSKLRHLSGFQDFLEPTTSNNWCQLIESENFYRKFLLSISINSNANALCLPHKTHPSWHHCSRIYPNDPKC